MDALIADISPISLKDTWGMDVDEEQEEESGSSFRQHMLGRVFQESENDWTIQEPAYDLQAGQVKAMTPELLAEWRKRFGKASEEQMQNQHPLDLFSSRLDWEIANWAIRDSASNSAFDRLLAIPGVSAKHIVIFS